MLHLKRTNSRSLSRHYAQKGIRVKVVLDEEKIMRENRYDFQKMQAFLDNFFGDYHFKREGNIYIGPGSKQDYTNAGVICVACGKADWFLDNVLEWRWYIDDEEEDLLEDDEYYRVGFRW